MTPRFDSLPTVLDHAEAALCDALSLDPARHDLDTWGGHVLAHLVAYAEADECGCGVKPETVNFVRAGKHDDGDLWFIEYESSSPGSGVYIRNVLEHEITDTDTTLDRAVDTRTSTIWIGDLEVLDASDPTSPTFDRAWRDLWRAIAPNEAERRNVPRVVPASVQTIHVGDVDVKTGGFSYPSGGHYLDYIARSEALSALNPDLDLVAITPWITLDADGNETAHEQAIRVTWSRTVPAAADIDALPENLRAIVLDAITPDRQWPHTPVALRHGSVISSGAIGIEVIDHDDETLTLEIDSLADEDDMIEGRYAVGDTFTCANQTWRIVEIVPEADIDGDPGKNEIVARIERA